MSVQLTIVGGPASTPTVLLRKRDTLVGRQKGCDIRIPSDEVSRRHCLLYLDNGKLTVEDLKSANGTFVNGERIDGRHKVRPGDQIKIGPLVFRIDVAHARAKSPPRKDDSDSDTDSDPVYRFADDKRPAAKRDVEIELDAHAFDGLTQGDDLRDLLRGMDR